MNKKNVFIGAVAILGLIATMFTVGNVFAASNQSNYGYGMMRNFNSDDFQKMSEAHNLMAQGRIDEARKIMQDLGSGNCPMLGGSGISGSQGNNAGNSNNNGNFGGYGRGMMGNF